MERRSTRMMVIRLLIALPLVMSSPADTPWPSDEQSGNDSGRDMMSEDLLLIPSDSPPLSRMFDPEARLHHPNESMIGMPPPGSSGIPALGMPDDQTICDMLLQSPEPPPFNQVPWFCVCSHCKGQYGPKGDRGDRGLPGRPGSPGMRGLMGHRGRPGFTGTVGMKGQKGDEGGKGSMGIMGMQGSKGGRGFKGDKGDHGVAGPPGTIGPQGEDGNCPASCETIQGPPGVAGLPGRPGARGIPGINGVAGPKGVDGDMGDMGRPGSTGPDGPKGDQGEQGICDCEDGATGSPGPAGPPGGKGEQGSVGPMGDRGLDGPKGDLGPLGMMGPPGLCTPRIQSGFTARAVDSYPRPNFPIPFPYVLCCNNGMMHFNPMTGMYVAPVNGTYVFSYHLSVQGRILKVGLFRNFAPIIKTTETNNMVTANGQVTLHLNARDRVWLQAKDDTSNGLYTDPEMSSTFSGFLLYPDSCSDILIGRDGDSVLDFMDPDSEEEGMVYSWDGPPSTTAQPQTTTE